VAQDDAGVMGPPEKVEALAAQPDEQYTFVLRFAADGPPDLATKLRLDDEDVTALPVLNGYAVSMPVSQAFALAGSGDYAQVWYLHPELAPFYLNVLRALDRLYRMDRAMMVVNLSLGPPTRFWPAVPYADSPFIAASRAVAAKGAVITVAVGNHADARALEGWVNPWSVPPWVIGVGAWDHEADAVAAFSARGDPARPETWPDVIARGTDVVGPYPTNLTKSPARRARDEGNAEFRATVPREKWDIYTLESGTSQATATVSGAAAQLLHFIQGMVDETGITTSGQPLFQIAAPADQLHPEIATRPRLTGEATVAEEGAVVHLRYTLDAPWRMVHQILADFARPVPGAAPHEAGAGRVDRDVIAAIFSRFGAPDISLYDAKVTD
jgi:hypothetical protein